MRAWSDLGSDLRGFEKNDPKESVPLPLVVYKAINGYNNQSAICKYCTPP